MINPYRVKTQKKFKEEWGDSLMIKGIIDNPVRWKERIPTIYPTPFKKNFKVSGHELYISPLEQWVSWFRDGKLGDIKRKKKIKELREAEK